MELCAGKRDVNLDSVTVWWEVRLSCNPLGDNINNRSAVISILTSDASDLMEKL